MTDAALVERAIQLLRTMQSHLKIYVHPVDEWGVTNCLHGFTNGLTVAGLAYDRNVWWGVCMARQWGWQAEGPVPQRRRKGLDEASIVNELIEIEIETRRRLAARSNAVTEGEGS